MDKFPHMDDTDFPNVEQVDVWKFKNEFDYKKFDDVQMRITVCAVPWDVGLIHVGNAQIGGLGNVVDFGSEEARDAWFSSLEDKHTFETEYRKFHMEGKSGSVDGTIRVPIPYDVIARYNYAVIEYTPLPVNLEGTGVRKWFYFIRESKMVASSTTEVELILDAWMTFVQSGEFRVSYMMLERGHAPLASLSADEYLLNPMEHTRYVTGEDVTYDDNPSIVRSENSIIFNGDETIYACIVIDSLLYNQWGEFRESWQMPQTRELTAQGTPNYHCWALNAGDFNTFISDIDDIAPQFKQAVKCVFFASEKMIGLGETREAFGYTFRMVDAQQQQHNLLTLDKESFGYDERYADIAKLYTWPYAHIEIMDENGNTTIVRVEDTDGSLKLNTSLSTVYPYIRLTGHVLGVGNSKENNILFKNASNRLMRFGGKWQDTVIDWDVPTFAVVQSNDITYDYATFYDRAQMVNDANTSRDNTLNSADTAKTNADSTALVNKQNANASAANAKVNSDARDTTNKANADASAANTKTNADARDTTNKTNADASAANTKTNADARDTTSKANADASAANTKTNADARDTTNKTNADASAANAKVNADANATTAKTNADNSAANTKVNADSAASVSKTNADNSADTAHANAYLMADASYNNSVADADTINANAALDVLANNANEATLDNYNRQSNIIANGTTGRNSWLASQLTLDLTGVDTQAQRESAGIAAVGSAVGGILSLSPLSGAANAVQTTMQAGVSIHASIDEAELQVQHNFDMRDSAQSAANTQVLNATVRLGEETATENSRITAQAANTASTAIANATRTRNANKTAADNTKATDNTNAANTYGAETVINANNKNVANTNAANVYNTDLDVNANNKATANANAQRTYDTEIAANVRDKATANENAQRTYDTEIAANVRDKATSNENAQRTYDTEIAANVRDKATANENAQRTYDTEIAANVRDKDTADANAQRTYDNARAVNDLNWNTAYDNAERTYLNEFEKIDNLAKQAGLKPTNTFGTVSNAETATTRPLAAFAQVVTQNDGAIASAGDEMLRFGYHCNMAWEFDGWQLMKNFTYWKVSDLWIDDFRLPDAYADRIRFTLMGGVCVWRSPDIIGKTSIYDN